MKHLLLLGVLLIAMALSDSTEKPSHVYLTPGAATALLNAVVDDNLGDKLRLKTVTTKELLIVQTGGNTANVHLILPPDFVDKWNKQVKNRDIDYNDQVRLCVALRVTFPKARCPGRPKS